MGLFSGAIKLFAAVVVLVLLVAAVGFFTVVKPRRLQAEDAIEAAPPPNLAIQHVEPYSYPVSQSYMPAVPPPAATTAAQIQRWQDLERGQENLQVNPLKVGKVN